MLPHSLRVVVTSFTRGISTDVTTSSFLESHTHRRVSSGSQKLFQRQTAGTLLLPSFFNDNFFKMDETGRKHALVRKWETLEGTTIVKGQINVCVSFNLT